MSDLLDPPASEPLAQPSRDAQAAAEQAARHTQEALDYMATFGIKPEGHVHLFLPPSTRQQEIHTMPYPHEQRQVVVYQTEPGEFSALCPFSGLPDFGYVRIEYVPGSRVLELKSLKYYLMSWRGIGAAQEDITAFMFGDLRRHLPDAEYLALTTEYNVRGGIRTTCSVDSRTQ
jgi:7-cyano-7-deazaguanine reductase